MKHERFGYVVLKLHGDSITLPESPTQVPKDPDLSLLLDTEEIDLLQSSDVDDDPMDNEGKAIFPDHYMIV